jgi:glycosyltransferase involved in cell wall biosynthesis
MRQLPTVSVIIPTRKRASVLRRAVGSVLQQSIGSLELIVVDDNADDDQARTDTAAAVSSFGDDRIIFIPLDAKGNAAIARNAGIQAATSEFIAFLDDDDWFEPAKLEKQCRFLQSNPNFDGVYCGSYIKGRRILPTHEGSCFRDLMMMKTFMFTPTLMFRKEVLQSISGFDERFQRHQDYELLAKFFRRFAIGLVPECLVNIGSNIGENRINGRSLETCKDLLLSTFHSEVSKLGASNLRKIHALHYSQVAVSYLAAADFKNFWRVLKYCIGLQPVHTFIAVGKRFTLYLRSKRAL